MQTELKVETLATGEFEGVGVDAGVELEGVGVDAGVGDDVGPDVGPEPEEGFETSPFGCTREELPAGGLELTQDAKQIDEIRAEANLNFLL
jgi:hypothetical protein